MTTASLVTAVLFAASPTTHAQQTLLNVSYDSTRELYKTIGSAFAEQWKKETGVTVTVQTSNGLEADVVTRWSAAIWSA